MAQLTRRQFVQGVAGLLVPALVGIEPVKRFWQLDKTHLHQGQTYTIIFGGAYLPTLPHGFYYPDTAELSYALSQVLGKPTSERVSDSGCFMHTWTGVQERALLALPTNLQPTIRQQIYVGPATIRRPEKQDVSSGRSTACRSRSPFVMSRR